MNQTFLKLIQPVPQKHLLPVNEKNLVRAESIAKRHNLSMLFYVQMEKYNNTISENPCFTKYLTARRSLYLSNAAHCIRQEALEKEIVELFSSARIPLMVIKGNEFAKRIYRAPYCRTSSDIDFLIKHKDSLQADAMLAENGYVRDSNSPLLFLLNRLHHAVYKHPKTKDTIEIHWNFGIPSFFRLTSEDIWKHVFVDNSGEVKLPPDMMLIQLFIHHYMHAFRELKVLTDIFWALYRYDDHIEWGSLFNKLKRVGLVKPALITLNQIQVLWKEPSRTLKCIPVLQRRLQGSGIAVTPFLLSYFKMNLDRSRNQITKSDSLVFRLALDRWSTIIRSIIKTVLPFPNSLKSLYGDNRNWVLPLHYLKFIKWRIQEWTS